MQDPLTLKEWSDWPLAEKLVQLAAYHCDVLHVEEAPHGSNCGLWVDRYLEAAGTSPGQPWCASFVTYLLNACGYRSCPSHPAAVVSWARWAEKEDHLVGDPQRGDLFFRLHADGTGHMGVVLEHLGASVRTIEGNSNVDGSRDGYAVVRHQRPVAGLRFIRIRATQ